MSQWICRNCNKTSAYIISIVVLGFVFLAHDCRAESPNEIVALFQDSAGKELCRFKVEVAMTPEEQSRGLMFRKDLATDSGMLFVNAHDEMRFFWMKNTLIPLDILFINSRNEVKHIHYGAKPFDESQISSRYPVQFVFEINAGKARKCNIRQGAKLVVLGKHQRR